MMRFRAYFLLLLLCLAVPAWAQDTSAQRSRRDRLEQEIASSVPKECFLPTREYDLSLPFSTWTEETLSLLDQLEPTGCGNPQPLFRLEDAGVVSLRRVGRDGSHLKLSLLDGGRDPVDGVAFFLGEIADRSPQRLDLLYRPVRNEFRGRTAIEAQISAINPIDGTQ